MDIRSKFRLIFGKDAPSAPGACERLSRAARWLKRPVLFLSAAYLLAFSSILRANFNYIDDMTRCATGMNGWDGGSRFLSMYLAKLVHGDSYLADVSPLPQLIAILFLALSGAAVVRVLGGDKPASFWALAAVLPLGLSPYFLECVSYKYDSPYMALSILVSAAPLLLAGRGGWRYRAAAALGSLAMCTSYQASSGVFPMLAALLALLFLYMSVRGSARRAVSALAGAAAALAAMLALAFGLYPFLTAPLFEPRAMFGFGVLLALLGVYAAQADIRPLPVKLVPLALSWLFFTFSFTYGNALYVQREYNNFRTVNVIQELNRLEAFRSEEKKTVQIFGSVGHAPILRNQPQDYAMLNRLVPVTFQGPESYHGIVELSYYYGLKNARVIYGTSETDLSAMDLPVLSDTMYFTIRGDGERIMIQLK